METTKLRTGQVKKCDASQCAYNTEHQCHALAITIGDEQNHPMCDTYCSASVKGGDLNIMAGVGACKISECVFNAALECQSPEIVVGPTGDEVDCLTFTAQ